MKALLITILIALGIFLSYDLFLAPEESREFFSATPEVVDPLADIPVATQAADPLAISSPDIAKEVEQFENATPVETAPSLIAADQSRENIPSVFRSKP